jgi:hypothetical protein
MAERGATNHLYARVKNMGTNTATSISAKFYYYNGTLASIASNYIPLPPGTPSSKWILIGTAPIASLTAGSSADVYVDWSIPANLPTYINVVGVQVSVTGDTNLYDNVGYRNFTLIPATAPPMFTIAGIGVGFAAGFVLMAAVALVIQKRKS